MSAAFTEAQRQAIARRTGPLVISAAAGSGKTSVLVERFAGAVLEDGIAPSRVLAITFTRRAAGELRRRIRERLLAAGERRAAVELESAYIGTVHSFCGRIARSHALEVGIDPRFTVIEDALADAMRDEAYAAALAARVDADEELLDVLAVIGIANAKQMVLGSYDRLRSIGESAPRLPVPGDVADPDDLAAARAVGTLDGLLAAFCDRYEQVKRGRAVLDFDDLELYARRLLEDERIRRSWSGRFDLVMIDEFQDINRRQLAILEAIDAGNLCAVGDEMQSIYGFRHADVEIFRERRRALSITGEHIALEGNFRCAPAILKVVERVLGGRERNELPRQVAMRESGGPAARVELLATVKGKSEQWQESAAWAAGLPKAAMWRRAEATLLAQRLAQLVAEGHCRPGDIAVLMRVGTTSRVYEVALQRAGLNTVAATGDFWSHEQVLDLLNVLRVIANADDDEALYGVLASPLVELDSDGLLTVAHAARGSSVWRAISQEDVRSSLGERQSEDVAALVRHVEVLRALGSSCSIGELIERTALSEGYRRHVLGLEGGARRLANLHKLMRIAERWESTEGRDLRRFLDTAATLAEKPERHAVVGGEEPDAVRLMTIHAAKGLEFPVVALADLGHKLIKNPPELLFDGDRVGLRWPAGDGSSKPRLEHAELAREAAEREAAEEDRLLYVAMTRAKERLILSGAAAKWGSGEANDGAMGWLGSTILADVAAAPTQTVIDVDGVPVAVRVLTPENAERELAAEQPRDHDEAQAREAILTVAEPRERRHQPVPEHLSYSSLGDLERCGYRYYLTRVLALPEREEPAGQGLAGRDRGTLVHDLLERYGPAGAAKLSADEVIEHAAGLGMHIASPAAAQVADLLAGAAASDFAARLAATSGRREVPFTFALDESLPLIDGFIDLLAGEPGQAALVVDYKSDRVTADADLGVLTDERYGLQRLVYGLAALRAGAQAVEVVHWYLARPEQPAATLYRAEQLAQLEDELARRVRGALARGYPVAERPHRFLCQGCPGLGGLCPVDPDEVLAA